MRQILGILFIQLYILAMLQPVLPIIEFYANQEYIQKVLCIEKDIAESTCGGKCHLKSQLSLQFDDTAQPNSTPPPSIDIDKRVVCIQANYELRITKYNLDLTDPTSYYQSQKGERHSSLLIKPPIV